MPLEKLTPAHRLYLYRIAMALTPLLVSVGAVTDGVAQGVLLVLAAVLGLSVPALAAANVDQSGQ